MTTRTRGLGTGVTSYVGKKRTLTAKDNPVCATNMTEMVSSERTMIFSHYMGEFFEKPLIEAILTRQINIHPRVNALV